MNMIAEFNIIGRVGKITNLNGVTKVSIASKYPRKDDHGEWHNNDHWNTVTIFNETTRKWIASNLATGDIVHTAGKMKENSYQKDGATIYSHDFTVSQFNRIAKKVESDNGEQNNNGNNEGEVIE